MPRLIKKRNGAYKGLPLEKALENEWTHLGIGYRLEQRNRLINLGIPDQDRSGHYWGFGTTRVGKTRIMEHVIEQDIRKGYSVVVIDPKNDIPLFNKVVQVALETGRHRDLMLINTLFPKYSAIIDPLSSYFMPEELVAHITSGVPNGRDPFFYNVAYEVASVVVASLIELAQAQGERPAFNLREVKNHIGREAMAGLKDRLQYIETPEARYLVRDLEEILLTPADYYSKVASSLRVALSELTSGNIGQIIGKADENRFIHRLEEGEGVILVVQLGSMLANQAAFTAGKVVLSMLQSFVGRVISDGSKIKPRLCVHIDEAQNAVYPGFEDFLAKCGGADCFVSGYCQSINQLYSEVGRERAHTILDNCNTKLFMRVPDADTAKYVSLQLGETRRFSPMLQTGGSITTREVKEEMVKPEEVLSLVKREFFMFTYSGKYRGKTADVRDPTLTIRFPKARIHAQ